MLLRTAITAACFSLLLYPESTSLHPLQNALNLFNAHKYQECFDVALDWVKKNPSSGAGYKLLGMSEYMLSRPGDALRDVLRATELAPNDADGFYYLGRLYFSADNAVAALAAFGRAVALDPSNARTHNQLGQTYEALSRYGDAERAYLKAIELGEKSGKPSEWPSYNLGVLYFQTGRLDDAAACLRKALVSNPGFPEAKVKLAAILAKRNQTDEALRLLAGALQTDPHNAEARYRLGLLLSRAGKADEAQREFQLFEQYRKR
jgi:tetratricopeptide (TPR) repeat protein